jgi:hypothetical protein
MKKLVIYLVLGLIIAGVGYYVLSAKLNILPNPFNEKKAYVLETPVIINEIKSIAELYSVCYYDQAVVDSIKKEITTKDAVLNYLGRKSATEYKLVLLATSKIYAGYDLSKLDSTSIKVEARSVSIALPKAEIIDIVMNPSDVTTFIEEGKWTFEEVNAVKSKAVKLLELKALEKGILNDAEKKGKESIKSFFKSLGFTEVKFL